jgi:hypothetical protein
LRWGAAQLMVTRYASSAAAQVCARALSLIYAPPTANQSPHIIARAYIQ